MFRGDKTETVEIIYLGRVKRVRAFHSCKNTTITDSKLKPLHFCWFRCFCEFWEVSYKLLSL